MPYSIGQKSPQTFFFLTSKAPLDNPNLAQISVRLRAPTHRAFLQRAAFGLDYKKQSATSRGLSARSDLGRVGQRLQTPMGANLWSIRVYFGTKITKHDEILGFSGVFENDPAPRGSLAAEDFIIGHLAKTDQLGAI